MPADQFIPRGSTAAGHLPPDDAFSIDRVAQHLELLRIFRSIVDDISKPSKENEGRFPPLPSSQSPPPEAQWRLQCFLMSAEVRYSLYLQLLEEWLERNSDKAVKDRNSWPTPPWDVAIILYCHMLKPEQFEKDIGTHFPRVWSSQIEFPITRLLTNKARDLDPMDGNSHTLWCERWPQVASQTIFFNIHTKAWVPFSKTIFDIRAYRCMSEKCVSDKTPRLNQIPDVDIPIADWSEFRLGEALLVCPKCSTTYARPKKFTDEFYLEFTKATFGMPVFKLWDAPRPQFEPNGFIRVLLRMVDADPQANNPATLASLHRYVMFLQLFREPDDDDEPSVLVPTLDIDLFWHTHQLRPAAYRAYCTRYLGRTVNHDAFVANVVRDTSIAKSAFRWSVKYKQLYCDPYAPFDKLQKLCTAMDEVRKITQARDARLAEHDAYAKQLLVDLDVAKDRVKEATAKMEAAQEARDIAKSKPTRIRTELERITPSKPILGTDKWKVLSEQDRERRNNLREQLKKARVNVSKTEMDYQATRAQYVAANDNLNKVRQKLDLAPHQRGGIEDSHRYLVRDTKLRAGRVSASPPEKERLTAGNGPPYAFVGQVVSPAAPVIKNYRKYKGPETVVTWRSSWKDAGKEPPDFVVLAAPIVFAALDGGKVVDSMYSTGGTGGCMGGSDSFGDGSGPAVSYGYASAGVGSAGGSDGGSGGGCGGGSGGCGGCGGCGGGCGG